MYSSVPDATMSLLYQGVKRMSRASLIITNNSAMTILTSRTTIIDQVEQDGKPSKVSLDENLVRSVLFSEKPKLDLVMEFKAGPSLERSKIKEFLKKLISEAWEELQQ